MRRRQFLACSTAGVLAGFAGCNGGGRGEETPEPDEPLARVAESELIRESEGTEEERVYVAGVVERLQDVELTYLEVRVEFLSADDEVLDSTVEHLDDVTEGDSWGFRVEFPGVGEAAARVVSHEATVVETLI